MHARDRLLSVAAERLYARLVAEDGAGRDELAGAADALAELLEAGLVAETASRRVCVPAPATSLGRLLARLHRESIAAQSGLLDDYERLLRLDRPAREPRGGGECEVIQGCDRVAAALAELQAGATNRCRMLAVTPQGPVPAQVSCQIIRTPDTGVPQGISHRLLDTVPVRMLIADGTAIVMRSRSGTDAAVTIREPVTVSALAAYFDLLWANAIQVPDMSSPQRAVLSLLAQGMTDESIARVLGMSARSVRRQVAALEERAGVGSRFALGAAAVRLGWLEP